MSYEETFRDAQTAVGAGILGPIGGGLVDMLSSQLLAKLDLPQGSQDISSLVVEIAVRGSMSALGFLVLESLSPDTVRNQYFGVVYFVAQPGLMNASLMLGQRAVASAQKIF